MPIKYSPSYDRELSDDSIQSNPYENVASANGLIAVSVGGGRHPRITCFAEDEGDEIVPYEKKAPHSVLRSTVCRDNRIITRHREIKERQEAEKIATQYSAQQNMSDEDRRHALSEAKSPNKKPVKVSERLYRPPEHLRSTGISFSSHSSPRLRRSHYAAQSRNIDKVGPNWGEDETYALLALMDARDGYRSSNWV